jgi:hypothetical protein
MRIILLLIFSFTATFSFAQKSEYFKGIDFDLLNDSNVLFFFPPSLKYEGEFYIYARRTNDPDSPMWALSDIEKILKSMADDKTFKASNVLNDTFNIAHRDLTRITVEGPKSLYDKFENREFKKADWIPTEIELKVFWRD